MDKIKYLRETDPKDNPEIMRRVIEQQAAQKKQQEELIKAKQAEMERQALEDGNREESKDQILYYMPPKPEIVADQEHSISEIKRERQQ